MAVLHSGWPTEETPAEMVRRVCRVLPGAKGEAIEPPLLGILDQRLT